MSAAVPAEYMARSVGVDDFDLQAEFVRLPADLAFWGAQYAEAFRAWNLAKLELERLSAQLSLEIRDALQGQAKGRVTLGEIEQVLHASEPYQVARRAEIEAEAEKVRLYGVVDAVRAKREMLVSLGAQQRAEMANDPMVRAARAIEREVEGRPR